MWIEISLLATKKETTNDTHRFIPIKSTAQAG
jgi:hypothetical protein